MPSPQPRHVGASARRRSPSPAWLHAPGRRPPCPGGARPAAWHRRGPAGQRWRAGATYACSRSCRRWELVAIDPEEGTIEIAFTAGERFLNPAGVVQGGFLAAMKFRRRGTLVAAIAGGALRGAAVAFCCRNDWVV